MTSANPAVGKLVGVAPTTCKKLQKKTENSFANTYNDH